MTPDPRLARHELEIARLILEEAFGPVAAVVAARRTMLPVLGAAASELHLLEPPWAIRTTLEELGARVPAPVSRIQVDREGRPREIPVLGGLVLLDLPAVADPLAAVEALAARVVDGGLVLIDVDVEGPPARRLERLLEPLVGDAQALPAAGPGRVAMVGRRRAPGRDLEIEVPDPVDLTAILYCPAGDERAIAVAFSLLMRQAVPPHLVLVLDDAGDGEQGVPEDLWGLAASALTQPALLRSGGVGRGAALAAAREHVETSFFAWLEPESVPAPMWAATLDAALRDRPRWRAAAAETLLLDSEGRGAGLDALVAEPSAALGVLVQRGPLTAAAVGFRREILDALDDADLGADEGLAWTLQLRAAEAGEFGALPLPLVTASPRRAPIDAAQLAGALAASRNRADLGRLASTWAQEPAERRRALALAARGRAFARLGALEEAARDLDEALERDASLVAPRLERALILGRAGDWSAARSLLEAAPAADDDLACARAVTLARLGAVDEALEILDDLVRRRPDHRVAQLDRLVIFGAAESSGRLAAALRDLDPLLIGRRGDAISGWALTRLPADPR